MPDFGYLRLMEVPAASVRALYICSCSTLSFGGAMSVSMLVPRLQPADVSIIEAAAAADSSLKGLIADFYFLSFSLMYSFSFAIALYAGRMILLPVSFSSIL